MGRQLVISVAVQAAVYLQGLILFPIVIRHAGAASYGGYVLLVSLLYLIFGLFASAVPYRYRRSLVSARSFAEKRELFEPQFTFQLLALAVISLALLAALPAFGDAGFLGIPYVAPWLPIAWLAAHTLYRAVSDYFRYTLRFAAFNILSAGFPYFFLALVGLAALAGAALSVAQLLLLQVASFVLVTLPLLPPMLRELGIPRLRLPQRVLVADFRSGFPLTVAFLIDFLLSYSDRLLIALFLTISDVGRYQPAYTLATVVVFLPRVSDAVMVPALSRMIDEGNRTQAEELVAVMLRLFLMIGLPFLVGTVMLGPAIIARLANPEIAAASLWVTPLVAAASICYGVMLLAGQVAFILGRTRAILGANLLGAALNVAANLTLMPIFRNITVPAATTLLGYAAGLVFMVVTLRQLWRFQVEWGALLRCAAAAAAMGAVLWLVGHPPGDTAPASLPSLCGSIAVGGAVYVAVLAALGGIGRRELRQVSNLVRARAR